MFDTMRKYLWVIKAISKLRLSTQKEVITNFLTAEKKYVPDNTKADVSDILKCALCPNMCRFDCPVLQAAKSETYSPAGKARIAYFLEMGRFTSDDAVDLMYACAGCSACQRWCPFNFSVEDLLTGVRKDIIGKGLVPSSLMSLKENLVKNHTIYEGGTTSLGLTPKKADILYFAGCTTLNKTRKVADATLKILEKAGINFTALPEEWCCGAPLSILGFDKDFKKFAKHNTKMFKEEGYKTIVCSCPECAYIFKEVYPLIGLKMDADIVHTSQFLLTLVKEGKITLKERKEECVYHDPCALARRLHIYEEPRALLKYIPGLTLNEAQFTKEETRCCG
ncbi:MAG: (Fe-S)-binding protein, partial [Theionarchaea archaeon]|nr:(Fe-S)-binding protein [Theionarchaea archaeon]